MTGGTGIAIVALVLLSALGCEVTPDAPAHAVGEHAAAAVDAADPLFARPWIDVDEWREAPTRHRYVHGGFEETDTRFSIYLPPEARYDGRFFQYATPVPGSENRAQAEFPPAEDWISFSIESGGYFLETNGGGPAYGGAPGSVADPTIGAYRANAAAARYSREIARAMYGDHRPFGYLFGGSGGAYRTIGSVENTRGVWDGAAPFVMGSPMAIPNMFSVRMHAMRLLRDRFDGIVDALEPGGSGDPYEGLEPIEAAALREVTRMGFEPRSWFGHRTMGVHAFTVLYPAIVEHDPEYFEAFWSEPGYLGHDAPEQFEGDRLRFETRVAALLDVDEARRADLVVRRLPGSARGRADTAWRSLVGDDRSRPVAVRLADAPPEVGFLGGDLVVSSGDAAGESIGLVSLAGRHATIGLVDPRVLARLAPGDAVRVDNSNFLAAQTYHRHQVPGPEYTTWDQFRDARGRPLHPQRPTLLGPIFTANAAGSVPTGAFAGRMIAVAALWDREAMPWQADWYRRRVEEQLGAAADSRFRLWYVDRALHGSRLQQEDPTRTVSYLPVLQQALRDLAAWTERDVRPPDTTRYEIVDGQVVLPRSPERRGGVQPIVTLRADGGERADVARGDRGRSTGWPNGGRRSGPTRDGVQLRS